MPKKISDEQLLILCLQNKTQKQIAEEFKMTPSQINRRIRSPEFSALLSDFRKKIIDGVMTDLTAAAKSAAKTLIDLLDDTNPFIRLQASCKILSLAQEYSIQCDIIKEINELKSTDEYK